MGARLCLAAQKNVCAWVVALKPRSFKEAAFLFATVTASLATLSTLQRVYVLTTLLFYRMREDKVGGGIFMTDSFSLAPASAAAASGAAVGSAREGGQR
jgi:hypothetical protein